ncbi:protein translocase subunit SecF [Patescibacteria group bacterium]|nr:protein translocase subunit SecF [Patescibacteria group bacterium]
MLQIIQKKKKYLTISAIAIILSILFLLVWGLKPSIDFTGGSLLEIKFLEERPAVAEVQSVLNEVNLDGGIVIQPAGDQNMLIRFKQIGEDFHQQIMSKLKEKYPEKIQEERFDAIGAVIGRELKTKAMYSLILGCIAIILYVAWAFRKVSWPVESWKYGILAIVALLHDLVIVLGIFALLGRFAGVEVGLPFVAALLTILGYSVNDTIVIFDRIRENLGRLSKTDFDTVVNRSLNETMSRSINTTLTTIIVLGAVFFFGGSSVKYFALALMIGIFSGAYSSIFIASPLLVVWNKIKK